MTWQDDFRAAVTGVVLAKGTPASTRVLDQDCWRDPWQYGTIHGDWHAIKAHAKFCAFAPTGEVQATTWSEFTDTDAPNLNKHGLYAVCSCACGRWKNITFLYQEDLGRIMKDLLAWEGGK